MGTYDAPTPNVNAHNDYDNGEKSRNQPKMGNCDGSTPTTTNNTQTYLSERGISFITLNPKTLPSQIPYP